MKQILRFIRDEQLTVRVAIPAEEASVNTPAIDFGQTFSGGVVERVQVGVEIPALPNLTGDINFTLQDSEDGTTFDDIVGLGTVSLSDKNGEIKHLRLPPSARRYVRATVESAIGSGNNTAYKAAFLVLI